MPEQKVDKAVLVPKNAVKGVVELTSNFTTIVAEANQETAGSDTTPVEVVSVEDVAAKFKPQKEFQITKLSNLGGDKVDETQMSITMKYGDPSSGSGSKQVMDDFLPQNITVKAKAGDERVLLDQRLAFHTLDDLQERLKDQKVAQLLQSNREGAIAALEEEIAKMQKQVEDLKFSKNMS